MYDDEDGLDHAQSNHSTKRDQPSREAACAGKKDTGKTTKKADKGKTAKEEARELLLKEASCASGATMEEMEEKRRNQVVAKFHAILRPFLLRRMKSDVELSLPRKKEIIIYANMTEHQKNLQDHLVNKIFEKHLDRKLTIGRAAGSINNLLIQLRKVCNHPNLLESPYDGSYFYPPLNEIIEQCGKFQLLNRLLERLFSRNHKNLIFSQWTKVLDIMDYYFSEKGLKVCRIDSSVKLDERKCQIQEFNDLNSHFRIFLLSTRAGGLGINLTATDTCILYDSDWNPQMDLQAMDRFHRFGQSKPVHILAHNCTISRGSNAEKSFQQVEA
ncbi:ATP-dependent DNA helicase ddm1 [Lathyrus oleraceus]|uniref:ATP-dependent DNA helicase ddm1 n=1 Tax=Pisum sativum TaxID=3888 RepID=A0A9D4XIY2_PEA|nr:ATP-dependent DNA helicase ddm1 [Pisum sativum]